MDKKGSTAKETGTAEGETRGENGPKAEPSPARLVVLLLLLCGLGWYALGGKESQASAPDAAKEDAGSSWEKEVLGRAAAPCPEESAQARADYVQATLRDLPVWLERARVDKSETLRVLARVESARACLGIGSGDVRLDRGELERVRNKLQEELGATLRAHHARLRRAETLKDPGAALAEVQGVQLLLSAHTGELTLALARMERRYRAQTD